MHLLGGSPQVVSGLVHLSSFSRVSRASADIIGVVTNLLIRVNYQLDPQQDQRNQQWVVYPNLLVKHTMHP